MYTSIERLSRWKENGSTLLISMVVLIVLTAIGIAAMGNSNMEINMARNFQLSNASFQLAETSIEQIIFKASPGRIGSEIESYSISEDHIRSVDITDKDNPGKVSMNAAMLDPEKYLGEAGRDLVAGTETDSEEKIITDSEIHFEWKRDSEMCPGGAGTGSCNGYTIYSTATVDDTPGRTHSQTVMIIVP